MDRIRQDHKVISISIGEAAVCNPPDMIETVGLGSCVAIILWDRESKKSAMLHALLPSFERIVDAKDPMKFADTGTKQLFQLLRVTGAKKENIVAKIAGGAFVSVVRTNLDIGAENVASAKAILDELSIPLVAEDTGGNLARTVRFDPQTGELSIKMPGIRNPKII